jgi:Cysteine-rich CPXCG
LKNRDGATMKPKKKRKRSASRDEGRYVCPSCGEEIVIPLDPSGGTEQEYVEDCPVCCNPNVIHLEFFSEGEPARVWAEAE